MKIAICTPVYGDPTSRYVRSLADMIIYTAGKRPDVRVRYFMATGHVVATRNLIAKEALEAAPDFLLWIDADMMFPHDGLLSLLAHNLPVVGCNYSTRLPPCMPNALGDAGRVNRDPQKVAEFVVEPVLALGLGFCLVSAAIMRRLGPKPFMPHPGAPETLGEDVRLFENIRALGEKVYLDHALSEQIGHVGQKVFTLADVEMPRAAHRR